MLNCQELCMESGSGIETEEWAGGPLETSSVPSFLILFPSCSVENYGLRRLPFSALSLPSPAQGRRTHSGVHHSMGEPWEAFKPVRLGLSLPTSRPGPSHSYSCPSHPQLWQKIGQTEEDLACNLSSPRPSLSPGLQEGGTTKGEALRQI